MTVFTIFFSSLKNWKTAVSQGQPFSKFFFWKVGKKKWSVLLKNDYANHFFTWIIFKQSYFTNFVVIMKKIFRRWKGKECHILHLNKKKRKIWKPLKFVSFFQIVKKRRCRVFKVYKSLFFLSVSVKPTVYFSLSLQ